MSTEHEILAEVESLKAKFSDTRALYREVCALLFFRYGITPTGNKLYQYVRKGSMNTPTEELAKFWDDLRHKARVEIDHPDLPDEMKALAAETIAGLWQQATVAARAELAAARLELQAEANQARQALAGAEAAVDELRVAANQMRQELVQREEALGTVQADLEAERRRHAAVQARAEELVVQLEQVRAQQQRQQDGFSADLAKSRAAAEVAQDRADAAERRALVEIDQERQARAKADKTADAMRENLARLEARERQNSLEHAQSTTRMRFETDALKMTLQRSEEAEAGLRLLIGRLEAQLGESRQATARAQAEAQTLQALTDRLAAAASISARPARRKAGKTE